MSAVRSSKQVTSLKHSLRVSCHWTKSSVIVVVFEGDDGAVVGLEGSYSVVGERK